MEMPNWKEEYLDFPKIPNSKKWHTDKHLTDEQIITSKLIDGKQITIEEETKLKESIEFYKELSQKIRKFDFSLINSIEEFQDYFLFVYNYSVLYLNDLQVKRLFRLVENVSILGKEERIRWQKDLSYPTLEKVKKIGKFNRANTANSNVFYASISLDTAIGEIKPQEGKLVTIGVWEPKSDRLLKSYPILHNPQEVKADSVTGKRYFVFEEQKKKSHPLLFQFMESYFSVLSHEFAKPVNNDIDYLISALFSERIFQLIDDTKWKFDCIVYPSVENEYTMDSIAIKPEVIDSNFKLLKVLEFKITNTYYKNRPNKDNPDLITLVDYENYEETDWIEKNGYIVWNK